VLPNEILERKYTVYGTVGWRFEPVRVHGWRSTTYNAKVKGRKKFFPNFAPILQLQEVKFRPCAGNGLVSFRHRNVACARLEEHELEPNAPRTRPAGTSHCSSNRDRFALRNADLLGAGLLNAACRAASVAETFLAPASGNNERNIMIPEDEASNKDRPKGVDFAAFFAKHPLIPGGDEVLADLLREREESVAKTFLAPARSGHDRTCMRQILEIEEHVGLPPMMYADPYLWINGFSPGRSIAERWD